MSYCFFYKVNLLFSNESLSFVGELKKKKKKKKKKRAKTIVVQKNP